MERDKDERVDELLKANNAEVGRRRGAEERARRAERLLGELLAVIHRDGGHHTADHGFEKSTEDAIAVWYRRTRQIDDLADALNTTLKHLKLFTSRDDAIAAAIYDIAEKALASLDEPKHE